MDTPLQISFRQVSPSAALEVAVNDWVARLDGFFDGIVGCRVVIDAPHRRHYQGRRYRVRVELGVPNGRIVVDRPTDENGAHEDPHAAIRDAFLAVRRQLDDHTRRLRGGVTPSGRPGRS